MPTILVVDDDLSMLKLLSANLSDIYDVVEASAPEHVLGLALKHKPVAILLDLMMPKYSGFELCQCLHTLSFTSRTPVFVVTGESAERYKTHCLNLGASGFIEKPVDFDLLKATLEAELQKERPERRSSARVPLRVIVTLLGDHARSEALGEVTTTENVSAGGFLCTSPRALQNGSVVQVFLGMGVEHLAGHARTLRRESPLTPWQRYAFQFLGTTEEWVLHSK
jgi:DNA-binding response OmpR family regulator